MSRVPSGSITSARDSGAYWLTMSRLVGTVWKYSRCASGSCAKANWLRGEVSMPMSMVWISSSLGAPICTSVSSPLSAPWLSCRLMPGRIQSAGSTALQVSAA
ncbi:hypothetical protein D3C79_513250 [compost metagenome]